ncbi:GGDEF domain-containing protein [Vibrio tapetis]|uniref:diguanylate cyclase n=1 Tax=Vibrio tapetis subsp. tapetis TaxID=1671868 RepID=A0A2N8Z9R1_9VIBR|nr:GGDEF domain-containing protein [Vibrio tapetis]SON48648.1 GGDEF family protein [Vibrio tapetis subsp. tapetis]
MFEACGVAVLLYIYLTISEHMKDSKKLRVGVLLVLLSTFYDTVTEIRPVIEEFRNLDSFLEDGLMNIAYVLIAIGITDYTRQLTIQNLKDELTGLFNRKMLPNIKLDFFDVIYFDLDGLKDVNDQQGHEAGDRYIATFAQALSLSLGDKEMGFRLGGDEFLAIVKPKRANDCLEQISLFLKKHHVQYSYGIESGDKKNLESTLASADKAMYEMKKAKRATQQEH